MPNSSLDASPMPPALSGQRLANGCMPGRLYLAMLAEQLDRLAAEARYLRDDGVTIPLAPRARAYLWDGGA